MTTPANPERERNAALIENLLGARRDLKARRWKNRCIDRGRTPIGERIVLEDRVERLRALFGASSPMGFFATKPELLALTLGSASGRPAKEGSR